MKPYSFDFKPFLTFSYQLPKIYLQFHNKTCFMKPNKFDFKTFSLLPVKPIPSYTNLWFTSFAFKKRNSENVL